MIFGWEENPISVDLETLGLHPFAAIIQIGAVAFNRSGEYVSKFCVTVNPKGQRAADPDTMRWWLDQGEAGAALLRSAYSSPVSIDEALTQFAGWVRTQSHPGSCGVFDGPVLFRGNKDLSWLENAYDKAGIAVPFRFRNVHEQRQFMRTAVYLGFDDLSVEREGTHHDALDDAIYQAKCAAAAVRHMDKFLT